MKLERWMECQRKEREQPLLQGDGFPEGQRGKYPRSKKDKEQEDEFPGLWAVLLRPNTPAGGISIVGWIWVLEITQRYHRSLICYCEMIHQKRNHFACMRALSHNSPLEDALLEKAEVALPVNTTRTGIAVYGDGDMITFFPWSCGIHSSHGLKTKALSHLKVCSVTCQGQHDQALSAETWACLLSLLLAVSD